MPKYQSKYKGNQIDNLLDFVNDNKDNLALKEEIPEIPSIPRNVSELSNDLGFITNTVNNLINYYKKSETYTKSEINNIVSAAASGGFIKVSELPTEDINIKAIYLVPYTGSRAKNLYEEYIYIDGDWEMIGTTKIDLSNYVTITALNTALADYLTSDSFNTQIANYYNKTEIAGLLADKIDNNKIGATNGVASLDNNGKVPSSQLPEQQSVESTGKAESSAIAPVFDDTETYAAGDRVMYEDELYVFNKAHTGAWDAADADKTDVDSEIPDKLTSQQMQEIKDAFIVNQPVQFASNPVGCIIQMMGVTAPAGYLACDGTVYNIADYPFLAAYFESQFGTKNYFGGDGTTTFAVPDLQGEFLRGTGTNSHANQGSGANVGEHQDATNVPVMNGYTEGTMQYFYTPGYTTEVQNVDAISRTGGGVANVTTRLTTGGPFPVEVSVRPTNTSVLYCIKY